MGNRRWTKEELEYLEEKWGNVSIKGLAKTLNRSINAVSLKANRIGLGNFTLSGDYLTLFQLSQAMGMLKSQKLIYERWLKEGLPIKTQNIITKKIKVILIDDFWEWAEQHQDIVDFSRTEKNILGAEPEWVDVKRKSDTAIKNHRKYWTDAEIQTLRQMVLSGNYTYSDIARVIRRTEGAIRDKAGSLGIKMKKVKKKG